MVYKFWIIYNYIGRNNSILVGCRVVRMPNQVIVQVVVFIFIYSIEIINRNDFTKQLVGDISKKMLHASALVSRFLYRPR